MIKRVTAFLLILCLLLGFAPNMAVQNKVSAASQSSALESFSVSYTANDGQKRVVSLLNSEPSEISIPAGSAYSFDIRFSAGVTPAAVCVSSTTGAGKAYLEAEYSEETGSYVTEGYFQDSTVYLPGKLQVEYFEQPKSVQVSESFSLAEFVPSSLTKEQVTASVSNNGETVFATVNLSELVSAEGEATLSAVIDTYVPALSGENDEDAGLTEWLGVYKDLDQLMRYTVPGVDDEQYLLYLDYSDPLTYTMIVRDVTGNRFTKCVLTGMLQDNPKDLLTIADHLSNIGEISDVIYDYTSITGEMNDLRKAVSQNTSISQQEAEIAYEKIDRLEKDRVAFTLTMAALPMITTIPGVAGGPPGILFSALLWSISASSDYFLEKRLGGITAGQTSYVWAASGTCGIPNESDVTWELKNGVLTFSGTGKMKFSRCPFDNTAVEKVVIGHGITNAAVTYSWLTPLENLKEVVLPATVTSIDTICFYGCTSLEKITLPNSLESIHARAFSNCTALERITIPASVTTIGGQAFANCTDLETVYLETGGNLTVTKEGISGSYALFYGSDGLKQIVFLGDCPSSMILTKNGVPQLNFGSLLSLSGNPTIYYPAGNNTWTEAAQQWQENWSKNKNVLVALGGPSGFCGDNLTWEMDLNGKLTIRGTGDMNDYSSKVPPWVHVENFSSVVIEDGVANIGREAFADCVNLRKVQISDTVESMEDDAFENCVSLESIKIPAGVKTGLSVSTFFGCSNLRTIDVDENNSAYFAEDNVLYGLDKMEVIFCPPQRRGVVRIPSGIEQIGFAAFRYCSEIPQICIPATVTFIDSSAFASCEILTDLYYEGSENMWNNIKIWDDTLTQDSLNIHYGRYPNIVSVELATGREDGGTVSGGGVYLTGDAVQVTAVPNPGYRFDGWMTEDGEILSTEPSCTLYLQDHVCLVALFAPQLSFAEQPVVLTDPYSKSRQVEITQEGSLVAVKVSNLDGGAVWEEMHVWAAEYVEDGKLTDLIVFEKADSSTESVYSGIVTGEHAVLYLLDETFVPMIHAVEGVLLTEQ